MNPEKAKRRQSLKILISESIMVLTVIITVTILAFIVSGYWLNSNFEVERNGLLQISSIPTGADVEIDGDTTWLQHTNTSKVLSSGKHTINLTKEGYDSWTKTINISEGLVYRLHYPRLFLQYRSPEKLLDTSGSKIATISPNHNCLILTNDTTKWHTINLNSNNITTKELDISSIFPDVSLAESAEIGIFTGKITNITWNYNSTHALFEIESNNTTEWILLDVNNPKNSINISHNFGGNFAQIQFLDNNPNELLAIQNNNLHKINLTDKSISSILIEDIINFDQYGDEIIFSAHSPNTDQTKPFYIGILKLNDNKITTLLETTTPSKVAISKFYDDKYITILENNIVSTYKKDNFELLHTFKLEFTPNTLEIGHNGEFVIMTLNNHIATLDMESSDITEWQTDGETFGWLDTDMIFSISDGKLIIYDYDGLNRRILSSNVSGHFPITITNDKWLYYFSDDSLVRETIAN